METIQALETLLDSRFVADAEELLAALELGGKNLKRETKSRVKRVSKRMTNAVPVYKAHLQSLARVVSSTDGQTAAAVIELNKELAEQRAAYERKIAIAGRRSSTTDAAASPPRPGP